MSAIHIRDVPEDVVAALKRRASRHHRSLQKELRLLLASIAQDEPSAEPLAPLVLETSASTGDSTWRREEIYDNDGR
jgi:plasmid stability protein